MSFRLLAYSGFDARAAIEFWEKRESCAENGSPKALQSPSTKSGAEEEKANWFSMATTAGSMNSHPLGEERVKRLKDELNKWEKERRVYLAKLPPD